MHPKLDLEQLYYKNINLQPIHLDSTHVQDGHICFSLSMCYGETEYHLWITNITGYCMDSLVWFWANAYALSVLTVVEMGHSLLPHTTPVVLMDFLVLFEWWDVLVFSLCLFMACCSLSTLDSVVWFLRVDPLWYFLSLLSIECAHIISAVMDLKWL